MVVNAVGLPEVDPESARMAATLSVVDVDVLVTLTSDEDWHAVCEYRFDDGLCTRAVWTTALGALRGRGLVEARPWDSGTLEWRITDAGLEYLGCYVMVHMDESGMWSVDNPARAPSPPITPLTRPPSEPISRAYHATMRQPNETSG